MSTGAFWGEAGRVDRRVAPVRAAHFTLEPGGWPEADARRDEIEAHFAERVKANPHLWNGDSLLLRRFTFKDGVLAGAFRRTDFAAFLWWRDLGWGDLGMLNAFALAAIEGSDGAFVLGEMGAETASAGCDYFPGGTPDMSDVTAEGAVDLAASVLRELTEETGLTAADVARDDGFTVVFDGPRLALMRRLVFAEPAEDLARRVRAFLATEELPELSDMVVVRSEADLTDKIAPFAVAYMRARWAGQA